MTFYNSEPLKQIPREHVEHTSYTTETFVTVHLQGTSIFHQELKPLKAVDLETSATVKVPDEITQPDEKNDMATVSKKHLSSVI